MSGQFVQALGLGLDPAWRRLPAAERCAGARELWAAVAAACRVPGQPFGANPHAALTG